MRVLRAHSSLPDTRAAVAELAGELACDGASVAIVFASSAHDVTALGRTLRAAFACPVLACTSAGQLGASGFQKGGITGVVLASPELRVTVHPIPRLADCQGRAAEIGGEVARERRLSRPGSRAFGLLLVDGLARMEERLAAALYQSLDTVPLIGGSAGDDLGFVRTHVLCGDDFVEGAAVLGVFHTTLPFHPFKFQHHVAGDRPIVVTAADPEQRRVLEIDGEPAADVYARLVGVPREQLDSSVFSRHPLVLRLGGEPYIRSVQRANTDASLTLYCAIDEGLVLTIGRGTDPLEAAKRAFAEARARVGRPKVVLGCDCILRRLELEERRLAEEVGAFFADQGVVGFSTYGEQFDAIHVNQTFTGVALGG